MSLDEKVQASLKDAMKARDVPRISALRMIRAALLHESKIGKGQLSDEEAVTIIKRVRKQGEEAADAYQQAGRDDLAALERAEMAVADEFLPKLADEDTTRAWVKEAMEASGATSLREVGKVMGRLVKERRGQVDASLARTILEEELKG